MRNKTVNGIAIRSTKIFREGDYWRWLIVDVNGREYVDGGNYLTRNEAVSGLDKALD